jgi:hypothetical protein
MVRHCIHGGLGWLHLEAELLDSLRIRSMKGRMFDAHEDTRKYSDLDCIHRGWVKGVILKELGQNLGGGHCRRHTAESRKLR